MDFSSDSFPSLQASQAKKRSITDMDDDDVEQTASCHHDWVLIEPHHHQAFAYLQMNPLYTYDAKNSLYNIV